MKKLEYANALKRSCVERYQLFRSVVGTSALVDSCSSVRGCAERRVDRPITSPGALDLAGDARRRDGRDLLAIRRLRRSDSVLLTLLGLLVLLACRGT